MPKHAGGRPTKFTPEMVEKVKELAILGATDKQTAKILGINVDTLHEYKKKYPEFSDSLKDWKAIHDGEIEASLAKRAKGYTRMVERTTKDGVVQCLEEMPPDPTSMIFWLKNRKPKEWRDKQEHEHSGNITVNINRKPKADGD